MSADRSFSLGICLLLAAVLLGGCSGYQNGYLREGPYQDNTLSPDLSTQGAGGEGSDKADDAPGAIFEADADDRFGETDQPDPRPAEAAQEDQEEGMAPSASPLERIATSPANDESDSHVKDRKQRFQEAMRLVEAFEYAKARPMLSELAVQYEKAGQVPATAQCLFWAAYCYEKSQSDPEAISLYRRVVSDYAQTRSARTARQRLDALTDEE